MYPAPVVEPPSASDREPARWLTIGAASALIGVSPSTLRRWDSSGDLPAERDAKTGHRVYDEVALRRWMAERDRPADPGAGPAWPIAAPLIGREADLAALDAAFAEGARLVVVIGLPGVGKSRLVASWVARVSRERRVASSAVGSCVTRDALAQTLAAVVPGAARASSADAMADDLARTLREGPTELLVLDELENLDPDALAFVARLARESVPVVATSRARPHLSGERVLPLRPLDAAGDTSPAARLFEQRVKAFGGPAEPDARTRPDVEAIVQRLGGLPLAIELAASLAPSVGIARLRRELETSLAALDADASHGAPARSVIDALSRLSSEAVAVLEAAAVVAGPVSLEDLEHVVGAPIPLAPLQELVDHSLLVPDDASPTHRFTVHTLVREMVLERAGEGRRAELDTGHAAWRAAQALDLARDRSSSGLRTILAAEDGLMRAWEWWIARAERGEDVTPAAHLAVALGRPVEILGPTPRTLEVLDRTEAATEGQRGDPAARGELAIYRGYVHLSRSEFDAARARYRAAVALAEEAGDARVEALACCQLAWLAARDGDQEEMVAARDRAARAIAACKDPVADLLLSSLQAQDDLSRGHLVRARRGFERVRALAVRVGDGSNEASALGFLGAVAFDGGDVDEAERCYRRAVEVAAESGARIMEGIFMGQQARALHLAGGADPEPAYRAAIERLEQAGAARFAQLFRTWRAVYLAQRDELEAATRELDHCDAFPDRQARAVVEMQRGHVDLARARDAHEEGALAAARRHWAHACLRAQALGSAAEPLRELRLVRDYLERSIVAQPFVLAGAPLTVGWRGQWMEVDGARADLRRRVPLRRILWDLALRRLTEPGRAVPAEELIDSGWPEERILPDAAIHRLHVALSTLRRLGLRDLLRSEDGGYLLAPQHEVDLAGA